jgi:hypothetical protein
MPFARANVNAIRDLAHFGAVGRNRSIQWGSGGVEEQMFPSSIKEQGAEREKGGESKLATVGITVTTTRLKKAKRIDL